MAPPIGKKKKHSSAANQPQQPSGSLVAPSGRRQSVRVAKKMNNRTVRKNSASVDTHLVAKSELTIWREIVIRKDIGPKPKMSERIDDKLVDFPMPDHPLQNKTRFRRLQIEYIDHYVLEFLRSNQQIFNNGTHLDFYICDKQQIWDAFVHEIWPLFAQSIRHLQFANADQFRNLRLHISPTILSDVNPNSINSGQLVPDVFGVDGPNATGGQALGKWLNTPTNDGQPKRLFCSFSTPDELIANQWINDFKQQFLIATTASACYTIHFTLFPAATQIEPFELVNKDTQERLRLEKEARIINGYRLLRECFGVTTEKKLWDFNALNIVRFQLFAPSCIGPLSPPETATTNL